MSLKMTKGMRKRVFVMFMSAVLSLGISAQEKRALLVGISCYDTQQTGYQWNNINGTNDIRLLAPILKSSGFKVATLTDSQATHDNIIAGINRLLSAAQRGDIIYFHFSGHGQPVEDLSGDEVDGWDEALVPADARKVYQPGVYTGGKHILDDDLGPLIDRLRAKVGSRGMVYVALDACHAGTSSRGEDDEDDICATRGTMQGFAFTRGKSFKPKKIETANYYKVKSSPVMSNVVYFESCRPYQLNREINVGGTAYGPLSYSLAQVVRRMGMTANASAFIAGINAEIANGGKWPMNQNLVIEKSF